MAMAITTWPDSSGLGNDFTSNPYPPIYKTSIINGLPVARYQIGTTEGMRNTSATLITAQYTIFVVASPSTIGAGSRSLFCSGGAASEILFRRDGADLYHYHYDGGFPNAHEVGAMVVGVWNVMTADWNGTNLHLWRNGTLKDTSGSTTSPNNGSKDSVGYNDFITSDFWEGDIAEVLVYDNALSVGDRTNVENFLKAKYGL